MKICVQGAALDGPNQGVGALAAGMVKCILHAYPEAEVFFLNYDRVARVYHVKISGQPVAIPLVNMRFSWRFWLNNNIAFLLCLTTLMKVLPFTALPRRWIAGNDCLRHLSESDLVLAISGGDSFSDIYGLKRLLYVSLPQILALWSGKRLILMPQTLGPFKGRLAQAVARYIIRRAERVYSRDRSGVESGARMLDVNADASKICFCYDVGFLLDAIAPQKFDIVGLEFPPTQSAVRLVGLNVSGLLFMGGYTRRNMFRLKIDYAKLVYDLIEFLIEQKKATVLLVPHVFGENSESDTTVCARLYEALKDRYHGRIGYIRGNHNQSEIKYIIGNCDFFVGSRMHACIAAVSQGIPAVPLAYSDKFLGVMQTVGIDANVADLRKLSEEEIFAVIDRAIARIPDVRRQLSETMPKIEEFVLRLLDEIGSSIPATQMADAHKVAVVQ